MDTWNCKKKKNTSSFHCISVSINSRVCILTEQIFFWPYSWSPRQNRSMSLVHSNAVLQALSTFTGAAVKPLTGKQRNSNELDVFNFLPTTFAKQAGDEPDSIFYWSACGHGAFLDPKFDYDFTNLQDNSACVRGNEAYIRLVGGNECRKGSEQVSWRECLAGRCRMEESLSGWRVACLLSWNQHEQC